MKSLWAYQAATARLQALREPEQSVCLDVKFDANGAIMDSTTPQWVTDKFSRASDANPPVNWARIKAPRLGIFAPCTLEARQAWYWYLSPAKQAEFDEAWGPIVAWHRRPSTVCGGKFGQHVPAARRSALCLHQQRGRGRALDAEVPGDTAESVSQTKI